MATTNKGKNKNKTPLEHDLDKACKRLEAAIRATNIAREKLGKNIMSTNPRYDVEIQAAIKKQREAVKEVEHLANLLKSYEIKPEYPKYD